MNFTVHQALFGQDASHGQGYEMLATSHPDKALVRRMANSTSLGEYPPTQLIWEPALRGLAWEDYYLLFKTYADTSADVRPGRVFSHTLLIERRHLPLLNDLRPLLATLPAQLTKHHPVAPLELPENTAPAAVLTPRLGYLLRELIRPTHSGGPIIWAGQAEFESAAALMWQLLNAPEREQLTLNLGFMPQQLRDTGNSRQLVAVPEAMLERWRNDFFIVASAATHTTLSEAEAYAAGDRDQARNLTRLVQATGTAPRHLTDLDTLQRVAPAMANLPRASLPEVMNLAVALHWYRPAQPEPIQQVIKRLTCLIEHGSAEDLTRCGSLTKTQLALPEVRLIGAAVSARVVALAATLPTPELVALLTYWTKEPARTWWRTSLQEATRIIFDHWDKSAAQLAVALLGQPGPTVADYLEQLPTTDRVEQALLATLSPSAPRLVLENGLALAHARKWYRLYLICALALHDLPTALRQQLALDKNPRHVAALQLAAERTHGPAFVAAAVELAETRLIALAGGLAAQQPKLLQPLEVADAGWRAVWLASVQAGGDLGAGTDQPTRRVALLFDQLLAGDAVAEELLARIGASPYADLRDYPARAAVWVALPGSISKAFAQATALGLLAHGQPESAAVGLEPELTAVFSTPAFASQVFTSEGLPLERVVAYAERFAVSEPLLINYLRTYRSTPAPGATQALGHLVQRKHWRETAQVIFTLARLNAAFRAALAQCVALLSPLDVLRAYFLPALQVDSSKSALRDRWWHSLLAEVQAVYYEGPRQGNLWEDSGGKNHVLKSNWSGGDQWVDALKKLRKHQVGNTTADLLTQLAQRHPRNETFQLLYQNLAHA